MRTRGSAAIRCLHRREQLTREYLNNIKDPNQVSSVVYTKINWLPTWIKLKTLLIPSADNDVKQPKCPYTTGENVNWVTALGK